MAVYLSPVGNGFQFFDTNGKPLNAGLINVYAAGTTTPINSYTTKAGNIANANPIQLGTDGRVNTEIWFTQGTAYKFFITDSLGNTITTLDDLWGINDPAFSSPWAIAGGTANAITAAYTPANTALIDGQLLWFRASAANSSTTPTFSPDGLTARTITKYGGTALSAGDISGNLTECIVRYNLANTRWELLNPATSTTTTKKPTRSVFTSGTSQTYSPASGIAYINVRMVGGGGGGGSASGTGGGTGNSTTFDSLLANGGTGGGAGQSDSGKGGSASGGDINLKGGGGGAGTGSANTPSGTGGNSAFGGGGGAHQADGVGEAGATNTGGGGAGGVSSPSGGAGGGSGGYVEKRITSVSSGYVYTIGTGGTAGSAGGNAGGAGGSGIIIVDEYYNP